MGSTYTRVGVGCGVGSLLPSVDSDPFSDAGALSTLSPDIKKNLFVHFTKILIK